MSNRLNQTHVGDCRELLPRMIPEGVTLQTCVTSPPYFDCRRARKKKKKMAALHPPHQRIMYDSRPHCRITHSQAEPYGSYRAEEQTE